MPPTPTTLSRRYFRTSTFPRRSRARAAGSSSAGTNSSCDTARSPRESSNQEIHQAGLFSHQGYTSAGDPWTSSASARCEAKWMGSFALQGVEPLNDKMTSTVGLSLVVRRTDRGGGMPVLFFHPGKVGDFVAGRRAWRRASDAHERAFLRARGTAITGLSPRTSAQRSVTFWGEWEADAFGHEMFGDAGRTPPHCCLEPR